MLWHGGPRYKSEARIGVSSLLGRLLTKSAEKAVVGCNTVFDRKYILVCNTEDLLDECSRMELWVP